MGFSWMGEMVARLSFCFQYDGETHLPNQGGIDFLLSTSCGETYLPKRRMSVTIRSIRIGAGPIAADDFNFLVTFKPGHDRFSRAIWQESEGLARLDVDQNGSIAIPTFHREVIYAYHADRRLGQGRDRAEVAQEGRRLHLHP